MWERGTNWFYDLEMEHSAACPVGSIFSLFFVAFLHVDFFSFLPNLCVRACFAFLLTSRGGKERMCSERGRSAVVAVTPSGRRVAYALLVPQIRARNFTSRLERAHGNAICLDGGLLVPWQDCREIVFPSGEERATTIAEQEQESVLRVPHRRPLAAAKCLGGPCTSP